MTQILLHLVWTRAFYHIDLTGLPIVFSKDENSIAWNVFYWILEIKEFLEKQSNTMIADFEKVNFLAFRWL